MRAEFLGRGAWFVAASGPAITPVSMSQDRGWRESVGSAAFEGVQPGCDADRGDEPLYRLVAMRIRGRPRAGTDGPQERMQGVPRLLASRCP
jgi:hypothetical protein